VLYGGATTSLELGDVWTWNGRQWTELPEIVPGPGLRSGHAMGYDQAANLLVVYGGLQAGSVRSDVWALDLTANAWLPGPSATSTPPGRAYTTLAWEPARQRFAMFGGGLSGELGDFWLLQGAKRTQVDEGCPLDAGVDAAASMLDAGLPDGASDGSVAGDSAASPSASVVDAGLSGTTADAAAAN
jgi:Galactose oxidase, central domain